MQAINENALDTALDAVLDYHYRGSGTKPSQKERSAFKRNECNREETRIAISAYLTAAA